MTAQTVNTHFMHRASTEIKRQLFGEFREGEESETGERISVLVVEDETSMRLAYAHLFRDRELRHCNIEFADSVNQAMALIATRCFDVAILDYRLGDGTSADLVRWWREYGYDLPFICVSGYLESDATTTRLGSVGFIHKADLNAEQLARIIRVAIGEFWRKRAAA